MKQKIPRKLLCAVLAAIFVFSSIIFTGTIDVLAAVIALPTGYSRIEAEDPSNAQVINAEAPPLAGQPAGIENSTVCSNNHAAAFMFQVTRFDNLAFDFSNVAHVQFKVTRATDGHVRVIVGYLHESRSSSATDIIGVKSNDGTPKRVNVLTATSAIHQTTQYVEVDVQAGENIIYVSTSLTRDNGSNRYGWCNIDYIDISDETYEGSIEPLEGPPIYKDANPIITSVFSADPSAHVWPDEPGKLYLYPSRDMDPPTNHNMMDNYRVYSTTNMVDWVDEGHILGSDDVTWDGYRGGFMWAPDAAYRNGKYYFYYPHLITNYDNSPGERWEIGVSVSGRPEKDFIDLGHYIPGLGGDGMIDPCIFVDDDVNRTPYIVLGGSQRCYIAKLNDDMTTLAEPLTTLTSNNDANPYRNLLPNYHEGSWMFKREGTYYLTYPGEQRGFNNGDVMHYATSGSPYGPWTYKGYFLTPTGAGTSHGSQVEFNGKWYLFYHTADISGEGTLRSVSVDEMTFDSEGKINLVTQTKTGPGQNGPNYAAPPSTAYDANAAIAGGGAVKAVDAEAMGSTTTIVKDLNKAGSYVEFQSVDGGNGGRANIGIHYSGPDGLAKLRLLVNNKDLSLINLMPTGGKSYFHGYANITVTLKPGETNTIRFVGGSSRVMLDYITVSSFNDYAEPFDVYSVTGVATESAQLLAVDEFYRLIPVVSPENATEKAVVFTSSDPTVASVSARGWIRGLKKGTTTVTATTVDGSFTAQCAITVYSLYERYEVEGQALLGHTGYQVQVFGTSQQNAQYGPFEFNGSASGGYVTTYLQQNSVSWANLNKDDFSNSPRVEFTIPFTESGTVDLVVGYINTGNETIAVRGQNGPAILMNAPSSSRQTEKVSIDVVEGLNKIIVTGRLTPHVNWLNLDYIDIYAKVPVSGVSLDKSDMTIKVGKTQTLTATIDPVNAGARGVSFVSSDPCIQVMSTTTDTTTGKTNAFLKGISTGSATITATTAEGSFIASCLVTVEPEFNPYYYDRENSEIADLSATELVVKLPWKNTLGRAASLRMIAAVYTPDGALFALSTDLLDFTPDQIQMFEAVVSLPENDGSYSTEGYYAKVFLWDALIPVTTAWEFPGEPSLINPNPTTFGNPLNLGYQYQNESSASRESADPTIVYYKGEYYLFPSRSSGYWWSEDLVNWEFVYCVGAQMNLWAPAPVVIGDYIYLTHSEGGAIYRSNNPKNEASWTFVRDNGWGEGDPALFQDDDGKVYAYYGLSGDAKPIWGVELDPANNMEKVGEVYELFYPNRYARGFEVPGNDNTNYGTEPWMEGAWMTKYQGKYYLQYAVPGTEVAAYANGCFVGDSPLGPFEFCENSPVSYKGTGFMVGAGHGATFQDHTGNWWKVDTASISVNNMFERRLLLYPATFDQYDQLVSNTVFADYPIYVPFGENYSYDTPRPDWNLLSYNKLASSSSVAGAGYIASKAVDESIRTWWSAATGNIGEWLSVDLGQACDVNALQINFADQDTARVSSGRNNTFCYKYLVEYSLDSENWFTLVDNSAATAEAYKAQDTSHDYYELTKATSMRYIRITNCGEVPAIGKFAISGLRAFGNAGGTAPNQVTSFSVSRPATSPRTERTAIVSWDAVSGAEGYIVRFGSKPDSLNLQYQVIGSNSATINILNMGVAYYFTVDSYNASGYTPGTVVESVGWTLTTPADIAVKPPITTLDPATVAGYTVYSTNGTSDTTTMTYRVASRGTNANAPIGGNNNILQNMHSTGAYCQAVNVNGGTSGNGLLRLCYSRGESGTTRMTVQVNGGTAVEFNIPSTGSWDTFRAIELPVSGIVAGANNTIRINRGDSGYNVNYFQLLDS